MVRHSGFTRECGDVDKEASCHSNFDPRLFFDHKLLFVWDYAVLSKLDMP
jgi:hypothetical protein